MALNKKYQQKRYFPTILPIDFLGHFNHKT